MGIRMVIGRTTSTSVYLRLLTFMPTLTSASAKFRRSELQHVWAVKSHDLLYKPSRGWQLSDKHVTEDMRQLSNSLRAADQFLVSIRDRARGGGNVTSS
jgi:hypothetical protein